MSSSVQDEDKINRLQKAMGDTYQIMSRIGGGGMGDVYVATHKTLGGKWAIKLLAEDLSKDAVLVERFLNEAKIEANLQHPNIVKVFDIGQKDQFHYLVMSFVEGEDLDDRLRRNRREKVAMDAREVVNIGLQVVKALECAHDNSIIHRDLKPSNIRIDRYGTIVVMDFGIARVRQSGLQGKTVLGERLGTPLYMSPEQAAGRPVDVRSDFYSLGVILYEMVAGNNPYEAENPIAICMKHLQYDPPPLVEVRPDVQPELSEVVEKLLSKDPENRYSSAAEVREDLSALSSGTELRGARVPSIATVAPHLLKLGPLDAVLNQIPDTEFSRALNAAETKLLTLIDGTSTIRQVLSSCGLPEVEASEAIQSLQTEGAVYAEIPLGGQTGVGGNTTRVPGARTTSRNASIIPNATTQRKVDTAPGTVVTPATITPAKKGIPVWVFAAVGLAVVAVIVAAVLFLKTPATLTAVTVDASPFATVTVTSEKGGKVLTDDTPFTVSLAPGSYTFAFESAGQAPKKVTKQIAAGATDIVRADFWSPDETKKLLESYIQ